MLLIPIFAPEEAADTARTRSQRRREVGVKRKGFGCVSIRPLRILREFYRHSPALAQ